MVMTPQMRQSIKILQLATTELVPLINQEIEQNPFLEKQDDEEEVQNAEPENNETSEIEISDNNWSDDTVSPAVYESADLTYKNAGSGRGFDGESDYMENLSETKISLRDHIIDQINIAIIQPKDKVMALHLTDLLDETGYLTADLQYVSGTLGCSMDFIEEILAKLQKFDPAGVFARNLQECLALQLKDRNRYDPAMQKFIENLELFGRRDFTRLKEICGINDEDLSDMCREVKALNPKPGNNFAHENVQIIQPDIFLKLDDENNWKIELNSDLLPKVLINKSYYKTISGQVKDKEEKKFIADQMTNASWLVRALDQRANTILKVTAGIVEKQNEFFRSGINYLKPLILSDIASAIEMHESTVSRVINGKYIATRMGIFELKYFFTSSISSSLNSDEDISSRSVKNMIKDMINKEDPAKILSDDKIAAILKGKGIDIARRTVMKYREAMNIPSSVQRRREKAIEIP